MGNRRMGLSRLEALLEAVDRDLNLANTTLTSPTITSAAGLSLATEAIGAAGAASITVPVSLVTAAGADMAVTLANGTTAGQLKHFIQMTDANSYKVTPATTAGAYTKVTSTLAGDSVTFIWTGSAWAILSRASGAAAGATAVVGMPIVA
tara:strand:- start:244 stop:693 length:450 start_codon:yes stop_codon:yes gene_type:complete